MSEIHAEVRQVYGSPRLAVELRNRGVDCSVNFVAKLMKTQGICARMAWHFVSTTDSRHGLPVAANVLDRDFIPSGPNVAWGADITYLPTAEGGLYLAVVEDLFSWRIVGWFMDLHFPCDVEFSCLRRELSIAGPAETMAVITRPRFPRNRPCH